jgi:hypothetical protein
MLIKLHSHFSNFIICYTSTFITLTLLAAVFPELSIFLEQQSNCRLTEDKRNNKPTLRVVTVSHLHWTLMLLEILNHSVILCVLLLLLGSVNTVYVQIHFTLQVYNMFRPSGHHWVWVYFALVVRILVQCPCDLLTCNVKILNTKILGYWSIKASNMAIYFFKFLGWGGVRSSPFGTSATKWPTVPAPDDRWVWNVWSNEIWQGKPEYSEETSQCHFVHHKSHMTGPEIKPGPPQWEAGD